MIIWIVEDEDQAAAIAARLAAEVAKEQGSAADIYWDRTILWESGLTSPPPSSEHLQLPKELHAPDIVILDLFDGSGEFRAEDYFRQLRHWEVKRSAPSTWVILWSVYTSVNEAQEFIARNTERDRRVVFSGSKQPELLRTHLKHCWRSWKEAQYP